jgi:proteasome lid subunit RPN8/RPN11
LRGNKLDAHTPRKLVIGYSHLEQIVEHARQEYPYEVCGLIGGHDDVAETVVPVPNASLTPRVRFEMERQPMVDAVIGFQRAGREVVAIYHSHPEGEADLSEYDVAQATWPDAIYLVVGLDEQQQPDLQAWTIQNGEVESVELEIVQPD